MDSVIDRVRQPEYTGENRCMPCTAVNVGIAALVGSIIGIVAPVALAAAVFVLSLAIIGLRGYLVPGTPTVTERYFPERLLSAFGKEPEAGTTSGWETLETVETHREDAVDVEALLVEAGAVELAGDDDVYRFTDSFESSVEERLDVLRKQLDDHVAVTGTTDHSVPLDCETVAGLFDEPADELTLADRPYPAVKVGVRVRKWPGPASLLADVAAHQALTARTDRWLAVPIDHRLDALEALRSFHDRCPSCGGRLVETADTVESCCLSMDVIALACQGCGEQLVEREPGQETWQKLADLNH